ncbi:VanZ family protein [Nocardia yamanashiensis]|uniref:VanZ family protein n=1 Tax=Nocardia yamanashiensis TaxID=209247 RepID=UPI001E4199C4|nr:VanZ family protein [Nocardia yamanashiensis]UGT40381.1 VanZ family protein [Nocardia yamanashiensis]
MRQVWDAWGTVLVVWALAVPVVAATGWWVARWRIRRGQEGSAAIRWTVAETGILLGTLPWIWMILTPAHGERKVILFPLVDLIDTLLEASTNTVVQVVANTILFIPLGFLLPLRFPWFGTVPRMLAVGALLSAGLETAQYVLDLGRWSSIDDVLMNATGAGIGAWLTRRYSGQRFVPERLGERAQQGHDGLAIGSGEIGK